MPWPLTWLAGGQDVLGDGDSVLGAAGPVHHASPALHGEADVWRRRRTFVDAQDCSEGGLGWEQERVWLLMLFEDLYGINFARVTSAHLEYHQFYSSCSIFLLLANRAMLTTNFHCIRRSVFRFSPVLCIYIYSSFSFYYYLGEFYNKYLLMFQNWC